jgi:acetate---CoA ligase (ADP-forming)
MFVAGVRTGPVREGGIPAVRAASASTLGEALAAARKVGYPVALKTDEPGIAHKTDVGGVAACQLVPPGPELIVGMARDPALGPLVVIGAGGILADFLSERTVALPPLTMTAAASSVSRAPLRGGARRGPWRPAHRDLA